MYSNLEKKKVWREKWTNLDSISPFEGTVRPDWISLRVVSLDGPLKGHQPLYVFDFFILILNIWEEFKFWAASCKNKSNLMLIRITICIESFLPIGWHTLFDEKIRQSALYIGLDCGMMKFFTLKPQSKEQLMSLPKVCRKRSRLEHMQTVIRTSRRIGFNSAWSGSGLWSLLKYSRVK